MTQQDRQNHLVIKVRQNHLVVTKNGTVDKKGHSYH